MSTPDIAELRSCGCRISGEFCPLHEHAEEMQEILECLLNLGSNPLSLMVLQATAQDILDKIEGEFE